MTPLDPSSPEYCPSCSAPAAAGATVCARCGAPLSLQVESAEARTLLADLARALEGRYTIGEIVGSGRGGITVGARHIASKRDVAIKVAWNDPAARTQVLRETILTAKVSHPNALAMRDIQAPEPMLVVEMPLAVGGTLSDLLAAGKPVPFARVLEIVRAVGGALDQAHAAGIIHGGLRPVKILLDETGKPLVSDFEIRVPRRADWDVARPSEAGAQAYMPLEQRHDSPTIDGRVDQYALAIIAYELLRGHPTWRINDEGVLEIDAIEIMVHRPIATDAPLSASMAIKRATAKDPAFRYSSVGAFVRVFSGEAADVVPREQIHREEGTRKERRSRSWIVVPALLGLGLLAMKPSFREAAADIWHGDWSFGRVMPTGPGPDFPTSGAGGSSQSNESPRAAQSGEPNNTRTGESTRPGPPPGPVTPADPRDQPSNTREQPSNTREQPSNTRQGAVSGGSSTSRQAAATSSGAAPAAGKSGSSPSQPADRRVAAGGEIAAGKQGSASTTPSDTKTAPKASTGEGVLVVTLDADARAVVAVDGRPRGRTPLTIKIGSGRHVVTLLNAEGISQSSKTISLSAGDTARVDFAAARRP